jgi:ubiquinone biosynthesis UbiH/UbiF/VisC/COQ6 family hydroxylase
MRVDIAVIGAGPAGLSFTRALGGTGFSIALIEKQPREMLEKPPFDGREIALTQRSVRLMKELGQWQRLDADSISPLKQAKVLNGSSPLAMMVTPGNGAHEELGFLVPNGEIRRVAFAAMNETPGVELLTGVGVRALATRGDAVELTLDDGRTIKAGLAIAADSRFSETRRMRGIAASMHDFGRTMMVCRMALERDHEGIAWEWFDHGQTLALLPLNGNEASVVLTLPQQEMQTVLALEQAAFNAEMTRRFDRRLGVMRLTSTRHAYPLVAVYAERFVAPRFACVGDAAVGMHPVTAHGFNFGLAGAATLAKALREARAKGRDVGDERVLASWEREHRATTRPLYLATNAIARLYTDESRPARLLREAAVQAGRRITPLQRALAAAVSGSADRPPLVSRLASYPAAFLRKRHAARLPLR